MRKEITFELIFDSTISIAVTDSFTTHRLFNGPLAVKCLKHTPNGQRTWQDQLSPELNEAKWINGAITKSLACKWRRHVTSWICNSRQKCSCPVVELHKSPQFSIFYSFYWVTDTSHSKYAWSVSLHWLILTLFCKHNDWIKRYIVLLGELHLTDSCHWHRRHGGRTEWISKCQSSLIVLLFCFYIFASSLMHREENPA